MKPWLRRFDRGHSSIAFGMQLSQLTNATCTCERTAAYRMLAHTNEIDRDESRLRQVALLKSTKELKRLHIILQLLIQRIERLTKQPSSILVFFARMCNLRYEAALDRHGPAHSRDAHGCVLGWSQFFSLGFCLSRVDHDRSSDQ